MLLWGHAPNSGGPYVSIFVRDKDPTTVTFILSVLSKRQLNG